MVKTAFVFPGQGSQTVGMLADIAQQYPVITSLFTQASEVLHYDLWKLVQQGPAEQLNQTEHTQVAMLTADVALFQLVLLQGASLPQMMAGHSLGEYAALVAAEAIPFLDAVHLVAARARIMQHAVPLGQGAMAAIVGLNDESVTNLCRESSQNNQLVTPANFNAIGQVVIAGHSEAVQRALVLATEQSARLATLIPVSVPCHCPLLTEASDRFEEFLAKAPFNKPAIDVVSNVDLSIYHSPSHIREKLKEQLYSPVRWVETIQLFKTKGIEQILECGPAKVLSGLTKRIDKDLNMISIYDTITLEKGTQ